MDIVRLTAANREALTPALGGIPVRDGTWLLLTDQGTVLDYHAQAAPLIDRLTTIRMVRALERLRALESVPATTQP